MPTLLVIGSSILNLKTTHLHVTVTTKKTRWPCVAIRGSDPPPSLSPSSTYIFFMEKGERRYKVMMIVMIVIAMRNSPLMYMMS